MEKLKQDLLRTCDDFSLGELFILRMELDNRDLELASSLSTPYGCRFLAMLKDLERLVDALKYAAELSFVLEESNLQEGVLKVIVGRLLSSRHESEVPRSMKELQGPRLFTPRRWKERCRTFWP